MKEVEVARAEYPDDYCPCNDYPNCTLQGFGFCYSHGVHEAELASGMFDAYRICFECGHVYKTAEDLEADWAAVVAGAWDWWDACLEGDPEYGPPAPAAAADILACVACAHDF